MGRSSFARTAGTSAALRFMIRPLILNMAMLLLASAGQGRTKVIAGPFTNPGNGHSYLLLDAATWKDSEAEAVTLGGHLATIRNYAEEQWVVHTFGAFDGQQRLLWIGLTDMARKFPCSWSSGESSSAACWADGEPNNVGGGEDFVAIYYPNHSQGGRWNDWDDRTTDPIDLPMNGVVEIVPTAAQRPTENAPQPAAVTIGPT